MKKKIVFIVMAMVVMVVVTGITIINVDAENTPNYHAVFGMVKNDDYKFTEFTCWDGTSSCWKTVMNYSFYLPYDSYVYVQANGNIRGYDGLAEIALAIDESDACKYDRVTERYVTGGNYKVGITTYVSGASLQTSRVYYLTEGMHTVHLDALATRDVSNPNMPYINGISISVIASSEGNLKIN